MPASYGLFGYPVQHSWSPFIHGMFAKQTDQEYSADGTVAAMHPLLARRPEKNVLLIVLSGDRGLCGAFNTNVGKAAFLSWRSKTEAGVEVQIATIGKKGRDYLNRRRANVTRDFPKLYEGLDMSKASMVVAPTVSK